MARADQLGALFAAWRESLASEEWRHLSQEDLRRACASQLALGKQRRAQQTLLRVLPMPEAGAAATASPYSVIELITDDMPFLVDTLSMTLSQHSVAAQLIIHPILSVRRARSGALTSLTGGSARARQTPQRLESWQYWRIDRIADDAECERLRRMLAAALADVRRAWRDWRRMRNTVSRVCAEISQQPPSLPADVITEGRALLQYMESHHFTFLGMRESRLQRTGKGLKLVPMSGSSLGLLRHRERPAAGASTDALATNIRRAMRSSDMLLVTKANRRSTVHRAGYLDYIGVKRYDTRGRVSGELRILGLWTSNAYAADPRQVPWLRLKIRQVLEHFPFSTDSHDGKRLTQILLSLPRDELFQANVTELTRCVRAVFVLQERARVRVILRRDQFHRFWSCLVYLPRDRCDSEAQARIEQLTLTALHGSSLDSSRSIGDSPLALSHLVVQVDPADNRAIDAKRLEHAISDALVSWRDRLRAALLGAVPEKRALQLERRYADAFPASYRQDVDATLALGDILDLEGLDSAAERMQLRLYRPPEQLARRAHLRILRREDALSISEVLPTFEHFGLRVIAERPYRLSWADGTSAWIQDFELEHYAGRAVAVARVADQLIAAFRAIRAHQLDDDGFNRLLLAGELGIRQVTVLRACCRYLLQTGIPFSQTYMERVLAAHSTTAAELALLFEQRLQPAPARDGAQRAQQLERRIRRAIEAVVSPDEDRILRAFLAVVLAALRTNYFRVDANGRARATLAIKLDPQKIPGLPQPRPAFEIFVHSPRVEGVHLRKGPIARGGIRWSERPEDFRTEILGLMKAQHVKNTMIVPVGAKGGFVARQLASSAGREQQQREVTECYRLFIRSLLDLTDNIVANRVVPPADVRRQDGDDPYLVVAADKGTASFSDIANAISAEYDFWLDDAFASGGSAGYDHKKMGITARGAWECVKRHFRELGVDIQNQAFAVAGIGDMSGDVFGNGMLRSRHIRLVAAFNHQHIFLDPSPDPERSFRERERLFRLPRSGWNDYDTRTLSRGGAIVERSAKSVMLSREVQALLDLPQARASTVEVIRAILCMRVDLLYNGGVGTYVKASSERHGEIGDRANDALRIDGRQVRARVVGEGGNLGFSQRGRIEYAANGGRLNADFIDNSAGVNTSDVEVNLKILLGTPGRVALTRAQRNRLLASATDEVADLVLRNNYLQSQAISLLERRAADELQDHQLLLRWLERHGELDRAVEFLPSEEELQERQRQGRGLTRPELALLLAYGKIALNHALTISGSADDPYLARELERYFPSAFRQRFADRIQRHRLRSQIINTATTNSIVNRVGPALLMQCAEQTGADAAAVARAYTIARDSADLRTLWEQIEALDGRIEARWQYDAMLESSHFLRHVTLWLLNHANAYAQVGDAVTRLQPALRELTPAIESALQGLDRERYIQRRQLYVSQGFPERVANRLAALEPLRVAPDLAELMKTRRDRVRTVARTHFALAASLSMDWLHAAIEQLPAQGAWQRAAQARLQAAALQAHLRLTAAALHRRRAGKASVAALSALERWQQTVRDLRVLAAPDLAALTVAVEALKTLAAERAQTLSHLL